MESDIRVPTSDFSVTFIPSVGSDNYALVDSYPATADSDWLVGYSGDFNQYYPDLLGFIPFAVPGGSTINNIKLYMRACMTGTTSTPIYRMGVCLGINGNIYRDHSNFYPTASTIKNFVEKSVTWTINPATSAAWTIDEVNGIGTYGLNYFGGDWQSVDYNGFYSRIYIEVNYTLGPKGYSFIL